MPRSVTLTEVAPSTTWLLVRISPEEPITIPVPAAVPAFRPSWVFTSTSPDSTFAATPDAAGAPDDDPDPPELGFEGEKPREEFEARPASTLTTATTTTNAATAATRSHWFRGSTREGSGHPVPGWAPGWSHPPPCPEPGRAVGGHLSPPPWYQAGGAG